MRPRWPAGIWVFEQFVASTDHRLAVGILRASVCLCWTSKSSSRRYDVGLVLVRSLCTGPVGHTALMITADSWRRVGTRLRAIEPFLKQSPVPRVLMVSHGGDFEGGAEFGFRDTVVALREKRPDLDLVAVYPWRGPLAADAATYGVRTKTAWIPWWAFEEKRGPRIEALVRALLLVPGILRAVLLLVRLRPTMVFTNTMVIPSHAVAAKLLGIPHYWMVREFGRDDHRLRFLFGYRRTIRLIGRLSESVICISRAVEKALLALDPKMGTHVVYPVIDAPLGTPPERRPGEPMRVVLVGYFRSIQGTAHCGRGCCYCPEGRCRHRVGPNRCWRPQTSSRAYSTPGRRGPSEYSRTNPRRQTLLVRRSCRSHVQRI